MFAWLIILFLSDQILTWVEIIRIATLMSCLLSVLNQVIGYHCSCVQICLLLIYWQMVIKWRKGGSVAAEWNVIKIRFDTFYPCCCLCKFYCWNWAKISNVECTNKLNRKSFRVFIGKAIKKRDNLPSYIPTAVVTRSIQDYNRFSHFLFISLSTFFLGF